MNKNKISSANGYKTILSVILAVVSIIYVLPVLAVVINSLNTTT